MQAIVVTVDPGDAELAADQLWSMGVVAIEERRTEGAAIELWTALGEGSEVEDHLGGLTYPWRFEEVNATVGETWRRFATPTWVSDDLVIYPAWQPRPTEDSAITAISIEPGATFGMGDHPTTILCLQAMRTLSLGGATVLDVGCGSGVLAVAACRLGARRADGIDISPAAVPTTIANAIGNGVGTQVTVSTTRLAAIQGMYELVLANILAPALIELAADLRRVLSSTGSLVISGILADNHDHVLAALEPLRQTSRIDQDGWTAITLRA